ncbi:MAG TPA: type II secretion system protein GspM [Micropepsaceae bacterium]|nr:type II secretion system protein GspM [Micropepsaceae bacterium]
MTGLPEGNAGKAAALAILVIVVAAVYFAILSPVLAFYDSNAERLEQRRELVRRDRNAVNDLPRLRALAKQRGKNPPGADLLLAGASDAIAAAALQSSLKDMVEEEGAKITSAATLPPESDGAFRRVGVRVAFAGDLQLLTTVLLGIEAAHPVLSVGNLELHTAGESEGGDENPNLSIALDVFGYRAK